MSHAIPSTATLSRVWATREWQDSPRERGTSPRDPRVRFYHSRALATSGLAARACQHGQPANDEQTAPPLPSLGNMRRIAAMWLQPFSRRDALRTLLPLTCPSTSACTHRLSGGESTRARERAGAIMPRLFGTDRVSSLPCCYARITKVNSFLPSPKLCTHSSSFPLRDSRIF
jgi:hypothetical protein